MDFSNACTDVGIIIQNMEEEDRKKIPEELIETINYFKTDNDQTTINILEPIESQNLSDATKELIVYIYYNYLGTEQEKKDYNNLYNQYLINTNTEIFPKRKSSINLQKSLIIKENKKNFFAIIIEKIKRFFK